VPQSDEIQHGHANPHYVFGKGIDRVNLGNPERMRFFDLEW
jgi:hypothetical protein